MIICGWKITMSNKQVLVSANCSSGYELFNLSSQRNIKRRGRKWGTVTRVCPHRPTPTKAGNKTQKYSLKSPHPFRETGVVHQGKRIKTPIRFPTKLLLRFHLIRVSFRSITNVYNISLLIQQTNRHHAMEIKLNRGLKLVCKMKFSLLTFRDSTERPYSVTWLHTAKHDPFKCGFH